MMFPCIHRLNNALLPLICFQDLDLDREEPDEIFENQVHRFKEDKRLEERTKFEEDNFTRITLNKKEKGEGGFDVIA